MSEVITRKEVNYKHPGRPKGSKGKPKYEDVDQYFQCPDCDGTLDNYGWRCNCCGFSATVYNEVEGGTKLNYRNAVDMKKTNEIRKSLVRINPWTGDPI